MFMVTKIEKNMISQNNLRIANIMISRCYTIRTLCGFQKSMLKVMRQLRKTTIALLPGSGSPNRTR